MEVKIIGDIKTGHVRTMSAKKLVDKYRAQLTWAQCQHLFRLKECNIFLSRYNLAFGIKKKGVWFYDSVTIPQGAVLDGSSVPALVRAIINDDYHNGAWEVHDAGYISEGQEVNFNGWEIPKLSRKEWDLVFREVVKRNGAPRLQRALAFRGLRLGGWVPWNKKPNPHRFLKLDLS